jgi:uncharacterized OB-fold protein
MGVFIMVIVKCKNCGKEYEVKTFTKLSNYQCECGGDLRTQSMNEIWKQTHPDKENKKNEWKCIRTNCTNTESGQEGLCCIGCGKPLFEVDPEEYKKIIHKKANFDLRNEKVKYGQKTNIRSCNTCGKEVSTNANKCPHCGERNPTAIPLKPFNKMGKIEKVVYGGFMGTAYIVLAIIAIIAGIVILMLC